MNDSVTAAGLQLAGLPDLPEPSQLRWQPLRLGLVELFHYDSEEFWFCDGHLLLRGNNGTGKSKVLSLTLPFLLDAQLKSSRVEPDGDAGKKMSWNLLLGKHDRRIGYTWIEFGRVAEDGRRRYVTLGCGLSAVAARPNVDSWFFVLEDRRIGQDVWLTSPQRTVLTKDRLAEMLGSSGQLFDTAAAYRRAVDERLFHLGQARYAALMDTLTQLRQPQLSKRPDEGNLSDALTEALPPLSTDLLGDVAEALNQLEEYRRELEEYEALAKAVAQFNRRYRIYAGTKARREARALRAAQTGFDNASRALNDARAALETARREEQQRLHSSEHVKQELQHCRTRLEALRADPANTDANRLNAAVESAGQRERDFGIAADELRESGAKLQRELDASAARARRAEQAEKALAQIRGTTASTARIIGVHDEYEQNDIASSAAQDLAQLGDAAFHAARNSLRLSAGRRRDQLIQLRRRLREQDEAERVYVDAKKIRDERADEMEDAGARRREADTEVEQQGAALVDAWRRHFGALEQCRLADPEAPLAALADWATHLEGDNPARAALHLAQQHASQRLAEHAASLKQRGAALDAEKEALLVESDRLERGEDAVPPIPHHRPDGIRVGRAGAPLWQLIEFREAVGDEQRAGLEAALEAAGLLDAWVMPDGRLLTADNGHPLHDTLLVTRPRQSSSLALWLVPSANTSVAAATVVRLLECIACAEIDLTDAETWVAPDGQFRIGPARGAWTKTAAAYIGYAARAAARQRRLAEIGLRLSEIALALRTLHEEQEALDRQNEQAAAEWQAAPTDERLRAAHSQATACAREYQAAQQKLEQATTRLREFEQQWRLARERLATDAEDLRLPTEVSALECIEQALGVFGDSLHALFQATQELRYALPELAEQRLREAEASASLAQREQQLAERKVQAEAARVWLETLRESIGAKVQELQERLAAAGTAVEKNEALLEKERAALSEIGETRARAEQKVEDSGAVLAERTAARQQSISALQGFAATGLLAVAMPNIDLPELHAPWGIEPALNLARRAEQALIAVKAEDDDWSRIQALTSQDYTELLRTLSSLGHQAQAETSDYGLIVSIVYQNRPERPDKLEDRLAEEIAQRRELLTANERKVLENHLQAEVAAAVQKLLQEGEQHVTTINAELYKRPTSTGVRFRLLWQPLPEGAEGAPVGLEAARKRLLNTSADAWSQEDRRVVGEMLHDRITTERNRADLDGGGSLLEQLARALDYRRWHRFRVQRWQDGQWRPLSGPASSGERALGLTVPLFAAVSSYYSQGNYPHCPRLVLLDEVFAGIDDAARAHCMALIREFDLDFVMTSEREWGCYAELPGVSICQLQRREGVDAVYVSRWTWDGRARKQRPDPNRRFARDPA